MMRTALPTLVWRELESLFFSPLAYIVLTVMLLLNGISFALGLSTGNAEDTIRYVLAGGELFWVALLSVPALVTMRLVAEERRSGTLEVLLTAPVRDGEVILAKFLGAFVFQLFLWSPTLIYVVILRRYGALPDVGQMVGCYLGLACCTALLTAVGLLFSTRTSNQLVAALASLVSNVLFMVVPLILPQLKVPVLAQAGEAMSMVHHFSVSFGRGLLDSGVLAFYFVSTAALLLVATRSLEARKWR